MSITTKSVEPGIVSVTVDYPPVNAIPSRGWFELGDAITAAGRDQSTHVVILRSEGRGFNAGVDIKEMQKTEGYTALIDANRGCFEAFRAVYECAVPVVAAVNAHNANPTIAFRIAFPSRSRLTNLVQTSTAEIILRLSLSQRLAHRQEGRVTPGGRHDG